MYVCIGVCARAFGGGEGVAIASNFAAIVYRFSLWFEVPVLAASRSGSGQDVGRATKVIHFFPPFATSANHAHS